MKTELPCYYYYLKSIFIGVISPLKLVSTAKRLVSVLCIFLMFSFKIQMAKSWVLRVRIAQLWVYAGNWVHNYVIFFPEIISLAVLYYYYVLIIGEDNRIEQWLMYEMTNDIFQ